MFFTCTIEMVKIDAKMIGLFVGGLVIGLVAMYVSYEKFFLDPADPVSATQFEEVIDDKTRRIDELETKKEELEKDVAECTGDLKSKKEKLRKTSKNMYGVIAGLGGLGLVIVLYMGGNKLLGAKTTRSKEFIGIRNKSDKSNAKL